MLRLPGTGGARQSRRARVFTVAVLLLLASSITLAGYLALGVRASYQRLRVSRAAAVARDPADIRPWMTVRFLDRAYGVPPGVLPAALAAAGFASDTSLPPPPDRPQRLLRAVLRLADRLGLHHPPPAPEGQSLAELARASGKEPADAVRVVREAIHEYRLTHPPGAVPAGANALRRPLGLPPPGERHGGAPGGAG